MFEYTDLFKPSIHVYSNLTHHNTTHCINKVCSCILGYHIYILFDEYYEPATLISNHEDQFIDTSEKHTDIDICKM